MVKILSCRRRALEERNISRAYLNSATQNAMPCAESLSTESRERSFLK